MSELPRKARNLIGCGYIHNMVQGINRENIYSKEQYKFKYIELIKKYSQKHNVFIISYCIMDNHAHILTYSEDIKKISLFMKELDTEYAIYYNKINDRVGYVFRNRFNSKPIYDQKYLLKCIKYIHMNPVKAGIVKEEKDYKFSSYNDYIYQKGLINSQIIKNIFNEKEEYLKDFYSINYEFLNLEKEKIDLNYILEEYLNKKNLNIDKIKKDSFEIKKFIAYLISNEYEFTKTKLADILKISRTNLYRKLKR